MFHLNKAFIRKVILFWSCLPVFIHTCLYWHKALPFLWTPTQCLEGVVMVVEVGILRVLLCKMDDSSTEVRLFLPWLLPGGLLSFCIWILSVRQKPHLKILSMWSFIHNRNHLQRLEREETKCVCVFAHMCARRQIKGEVPVLQTAVYLWATAPCDSWKWLIQHLRQENKMSTWAASSSITHPLNPQPPAATWSPQNTASLP